MPAEQLAAMLAGGDPRSLGRTAEAVELALAEPDRVGELLDCLRSEDAVVRMRAGDALEKVLAARPELATPHLDRVLDEVAAIDQASVRWHVAQIVREVPLTPAQRARAIAVLHANLDASDDWIVVNETLSTLVALAGDDAALRAELRPMLTARTGDARPAVARRASRLLSELGPDP